MAPGFKLLLRPSFSSLYAPRAMSIPQWDAFQGSSPDNLFFQAGPGGARNAPRTLRVLLLAASVLAGGCDPGLGVDPAWGEATLPSDGYLVNDSMANVGAELFRRNCAACHSHGGGDVIGPDMRGVTLRRTQPWIRAMISRPDSMLRVDSIAQTLLAEYQIPMLNRELDAARVRAVMEFLWRADHPGSGGPVEGQASTDSAAP